MHTVIIAAARRCLYTFLTVLLLLAFNGTYAQAITHKPALLLGKINTTNNNAVITHAQLIANTTLLTEGGCTIKSYTISFAPQGEEAHIMGPYKVIGNVIPAEKVSYLTSSKNDRIKVFIEDAQVLCAGKDIMAAPIVFTIIP